MRRVPIWCALLPAVAGAADVDLGMDLGYRAADMRWSIAGTSSGCCPNVLSELTWDNLEVAELSLHLKSFTQSGLVFSAEGAYGSIYSGDNRDSDYLGDNRSLEFTRSENATDGDAMWYGSLGLGWRLRGTGVGSMATLVPWVGYAQHGQDLRITDGYQTVSAYGFPQPLGPFDGLDSTYRSRWTGPWAGLDLELEPGAGVQLTLGMQYHWPDYYAKANWNLRYDYAHPVSFEQKADGQGQVLRLGLSLPGPDAAPTLRWRIDADWERWESDAGVDRVFFADGTTATTRLNEVVLNTWSVSAGFDARF